MSNIKPAVEGDNFELNGETMIVSSKCDESFGVWFCTTHSEAFPNNMSKDSHCRDGEHVLAWGCATHGPEVP